MDRATILGKVADIVAETLGTDASDIKESTTFDQLDADSLDRLELVTAFEDEFELTIPDDDLAKIATVKDAVDAIENAS